MDANKISYKMILTRLAVVLAMLACSFVSVIQSYNIIITYDYGIDMSGLYQTIKWTLPFLMTIIYYALYRIYVGLMRGTLNSRMSLFGRVISTESLRARVDPLMALLALWVALVNVLFMFFPLYKNLLYVLLKEVGALAVSYAIYVQLNKNLEEVYRPIVYWGLQLSLVLLVVLV